MTQTWKEHYEQTKDKPPSELLKRAVSFVQRKGSALDLGSGALVDSNYLISEGFGKVTAVDKEGIPESILLELPKSSFEFFCASFDQFKFPIKEYDLVNASYSLPFNPPETFGAVWDGLQKSIINSGIFAGQFFGVRDEWNDGKTSMTFHTEVEARNLLHGMKLIEFREMEKDGQLANGDQKHWHVFHAIARVNAEQM